MSSYLCKTRMLQVEKGKFAEGNGLIRQAVFWGVAKYATNCHGSSWSAINGFGSEFLTSISITMSASD